jgi:hypothetical protein
MFMTPLATQCMSKIEMLGFSRTLTWAVQSKGVSVSSNAFPQSRANIKNLISLLSNVYSAAHHWSPLSDEVVFVRTKRDIQQASFECAKDRHLIPWCDVNVRFGIVRYADCGGKANGTCDDSDTEHTR